jgi:hypothetical protein
MHPGCPSRTTRRTARLPARPRRRRARIGQCHDNAGSSRIAELTVGKPYARQCGVAHNVVNTNDFELVFIEIELKPTSAGP